jgi:radical SAM protein with 4Fe4S-binding SPASM domain
MTKEKEHVDHLNSQILNYSKYYNRVKNDKEFSNYRDLWEKASNFEIETNYPLQIEFELSNACNYRCTFCPFSFKKEDMPVNFDLPKKDKILDFELYKKIIDEGSENGLKAIELGFNTEPLIYKKIIPVIQYARDKNIIDIRITSNGSKLTPETSRELIDAGLTHLSVSIDAFSKETYLKVRSSRFYEKVVNNLLEFIKIRNERGNALPTVRVSFVENEENKHEREDFIAFWEDKVDLLSMQSLIKYDGTPDELKSKKKINNIKYNCHQPWTRMVVRSNGDIIPCCTVPGMEFKLKNAKDVSLKEIWDSKYLKNLRKDLKNGEGYKNKICKSCLENIEEKSS